jgi:hypothetical protein
MVRTIRTDAKKRVILDSLQRRAARPLPDSFLFIHRDLIIALAAQHRVPAVYVLPSYSARGGLLSYGIDRTGVYWGAAPYVDRILKGEKPADLLVQMPTEYRLVVAANIAKLSSDNILNKDGVFGSWSADAVRVRADTTTLVNALLALASLAENRGRSI